MVRVITMSAVRFFSAALDAARIAWYVRDVRRGTFEPTLERCRRQGGLSGRVAFAGEAASVLVRRGVFGKLVRIARAAERRGSTVWLLGRDCDVIVMALRELGVSNVRYLFGIDRRMVTERPHTVWAIAKLLVRPRDVVVDTGYSGSIVRRFMDAAGAIGVILSSDDHADSRVVRLDAGLSRAERVEVSSAISLIEDMKVDEHTSARSNRTHHLPWRTVERWLVDTVRPGSADYEEAVFMHLAHMEFVCTFVDAIKSSFMGLEI